MAKHDFCFFFRWCAFQIAGTPLIASLPAKIAVLGMVGRYHGLFDFACVPRLSLIALSWQPGFYQVQVALQDL